MTCFQPILVPFACPAAARDLLPLIETMPVPVSMSTARGVGTPYPAGAPCLSFLPDLFEAAPYDLRVSHKDNLLPSRGGPLPTIGVADDIRDDAMARLYQLSVDRLRGISLFGQAMSASGFTAPNTPCPAGGFRVHVFDRFIAYSGTPQHRPIATQMPLSVFPDGRHVAELGHHSPKMPVLVISVFFHRPRPRHFLLQKARLADAWVAMLARKEGWPQPLPIRLPAACAA